MLARSRARHCLAGRPVWRNLTASKSISNRKWLIYCSKIPNQESLRWPVMVGIIVGGVVALIAAVCGIRCCCRRRRRRRGMDPSDPSLLHTSSQAYQPTTKPPAYESPKIVAHDFRPMPKTKDAALPPIPSGEFPLKKKLSDEEWERGMELESLKVKPNQHQPVSKNEAGQPQAGLIPLKTTSFKNPFEAPAHSHNPFNASGLGENRDYNPTSPLSPQRSYSPFSPSNYTRYTTSPFNDPPSRQPSPFSSAASIRSVSYVPPQPSYAAYSSSMVVPQSPSLLDEPKSPYRAYSPLLMPRHEYSAPTPPPAVVDAPSEIAPRDISPLNNESLELGTSYNMRPQSMALDRHLGEHVNQAAVESPSEQKAPIPHGVPEPQPMSPAPGATPQGPQEDRREAAAPLPQELPTRQSIYGAALLPSATASMAPPADETTRTRPEGSRDKNPFRNP